MGVLVSDAGKVNCVRLGLCYQEHAKNTTLRKTGRGATFRQVLPTVSGSEVFGVRMFWQNLFGLHNRAPAKCRAGPIRTTEASRPSTAQSRGRLLGAR